MNSRMPARARLAKDEITVFRQLAELIDLRDRCVVEIGGCMSAPVVAEAGVRRWWACDPRFPAGESDPVVSLGAKAEKIPLPDQVADLVFSCNALQHVTSVASVFAEAARLLKPGGIFYANFGPVWSAPDGAHIENVAFRNGVLNFWDGALIPAWSHLLVDSRDEFRRLLERLHAPDLARVLSDYVFGSDWINRTFADEFRECAAAQNFHIAFFEGCADFDYRFAAPAGVAELAERARPERMLKEIRKRRHGRIHDVTSRDIEFVLVRQ